MNLNKFFILLFFVSGGVFSQETPPAISLMIDKSNPSKSVSITNKLDTATRDFIFNRTSRKDGYLRVESSLDYVQLVDDFKVDSASLTRFAIPAVSIKDVTLPEIFFLGAIPEDTHRKNYVFETAEGRRIVYTHWKFKAAGARVVIPKEAFNQRIDGKDAVVSLSIAAGSERCLWKVSWWASGIGHEIYVQDSCDISGVPTSKVYDVKWAALRIVRWYKVYGN